MTKEARTKQLLRRTFVAGCVTGALIMYGISNIELPEPQPKCSWEACDCTDPFGNPLYDTHRHCSVHGHDEECTLGIYP